MSIIPSRKGSMRDAILLSPQLHPLLSLSNNLPSNYWVTGIDYEPKLHRFGEFSYLKVLMELIITCRQAQLPGAGTSRMLCTFTSAAGRRDCFCCCCNHKCTVKTLLPCMGCCQQCPLQSLWYSLVSHSEGMTEPGAPGFAAPGEQQYINFSAVPDLWSRSVFPALTAALLTIHSIHNWTRSCSVQLFIGISASTTHPCCQGAITALQSCNSFWDSNCHSSTTKLEVGIRKWTQ